jgi:hypothetical protein
MSTQGGEYNEEFREVSGSVRLDQHGGDSVRPKADANADPTNTAAADRCSANGRAANGGTTHGSAAYGSPDRCADRHPDAGGPAAPGYDHQHP